MSLRIGIDAHAAEAGGTGNGTYIRGLIQGLLEIDSGNTYILYVTDPAHPFFAGLRLPENAEIRPLPAAKAFIRIPVHLARMSRRDRLDILHVQYIAPPVHDGKLVATIHDLGFLRVPQTFPRFFNLRSRILVRRTARRAAQVITGSNYSRTDILRTYGLPPEKIAAVPYGVSTAFSHPHSKDDIRDVAVRYGIVRPYVLCVGRLNPRKNLPVLAAAFADAKSASGAPHTLVIAGRADFASDRIISEAARRAGDTVRFTDFVRDEDLPALYQGADVFVYPSLFEGFGLPVLEAMAAGVPVVTSNTTSLAETAAGAALTVDPSDPAALADALHAMMTDPEIRRACRKKGRIRAAAFTWRETARWTLEIYRAAALT